MRVMRVTIKWFEILGEAVIGGFGNGERNVRKKATYLVQHGDHFAESLTPFWKLEVIRLERCPDCERRELNMFLMALDLTLEGCY